MVLTLPDCETTNGCPAIVMVPFRAAPLFDPTQKSTVPLPEPAVPESMEIQSALLFVVQAQPAPAVTLIVPVPPETGRSC